MRSYPTEEDDLKELQELNAAPWQANLLKLNPSYIHWGNFEDYMSKDKDTWDSRVNLSSWSEHWELDELNELVNFYFNIHRKNHTCPACDGTGLNPATKRLSDDWYDFDDTGRKWCDKINDNEVLALAKGGRLFIMTEKVYFSDDLQKWVKWDSGEKIILNEMPVLPAAAEVNASQKRGGLNSHDAINRWICTEQRAKDLGVYGHCSECEGRGYIYDEDHATASLQLWYLLPRKGCSRGVYIERIEENEIPEILLYLKNANERNAERFKNVIEALEFINQ